MVPPRLMQQMLQCKGDYPGRQYEYVKTAKYVLRNMIKQKIELLKPHMSYCIAGASNWSVVNLRLMIV
jgi:hypothetical protein